MYNAIQIILYNVLMYNAIQQFRVMFFSWNFFLLLFKKNDLNC